MLLMLIMLILMLMLLLLLMLMFVSAGRYDVKANQTQSGDQNDVCLVASPTNLLYQRDPS